MLMHKVNLINLFFNNKFLNDKIKGGILFADKMNNIAIHTASILNSSAKTFGGSFFLNADNTLKFNNLKVEKKIMLKEVLLISNKKLQL